MTKVIIVTDDVDETIIEEIDRILTEKKQWNPLEDF